jgi:hypothetical protein
MLQAAPAPPPASAAKVVPLFRVKDKRTIEEVQAVRNAGLEPHVVVQCVFIIVVISTLSVWIDQGEGQGVGWVGGWR